MTNATKAIAINEYPRTQKSQKAAPGRIAAPRALEGVLDELTLACILEISGRAGVSDVELLRHVVREWYRVQFDVTAGYLKRAIRRSKRDAAKWETGTQG